MAKIFNFNVASFLILPLLSVSYGENVPTPELDSVSKLEIRNIMKSRNDDDSRSVEDYYNDFDDSDDFDDLDDDKDDRQDEQSFNKGCLSYPFKRCGKGVCRIRCKKGEIESSSPSSVCPLCKCCYSKSQSLSTTPSTTTTITTTVDSCNSHKKCGSRGECKKNCSKNEKSIKSTACQGCLCCQLKSKNPKNKPISNDKRKSCPVGKTCGFKAICKTQCNRSETLIKSKKCPRCNCCQKK